jgi:hypothetical protein
LNYLGQIFGLDFRNTFNIVDHTLKYNQLAMKYNINVMKSVWRRLRKPEQVTLDAIGSQRAVYSEAIDKPGLAALGFSFLSPSGGPWRGSSRRQLQAESQHEYN